MLLGWLGGTSSDCTSAIPQVLLGQAMTMNSWTRSLHLQFTIYRVMPCIFATPPTNNDTGVQQMSRCWILRQNIGLLIGFDDKVGARRCILRRQRLSILGCIRSCLLQLLRGYYLKLFRTQGLMSCPERIWESNGVCIKFQIAKHIKVGSGADGRMPPISPPVLA